MLVILCGPPCTGKSSIGAELERQFGFVHLEMDAIRQRILPDSDQRQEHRDMGYRAMHLLAENLLCSGKTVIVNATYNRELHRNELVSMSRSTGSPGVLIQCKAPLGVVLSRFKSRPPGHAALDLTEELVRELWSKFAYSTDGILVDTGRAPELSLDEVRKHLGRGGGDSLANWVKME